MPTFLTDGDLHSCDRLNLDIVDRLIEAKNPGRICGRAPLVNMLLDLIEETPEALVHWVEETDPGRYAEGRMGTYRGVEIRRFKPVWNSALRLEELWLTREGDERFTIIRDNETMETVKL